MTTLRGGGGIRLPSKFFRTRLNQTLNQLSFNVDLKTRALFNIKSKIKHFDTFDFNRTPAGICIKLLHNCENVLLNYSIVKGLHSNALIYL